jgi:aldehyde:ferredoxin oxidoreductase
MDYAEKFLGGRGLAARIYWHEVPPEIGAFDAGNRLIFALGPMAGIPVIGGSRWGVYGKSPHTTPQKFNYCNLGGRWGAELKFAGYDGIVVHGQTDKPVYLFLHDGVAEFKDASSLWGKGTKETIEMLKVELGNDVKVVTIGPAGENMTAAGILLADNDATGSAGFGSVMGSKRLKAIAVRGSRKRVEVAAPERLRELSAYLRSLDRTAIVAWGVDFSHTGPNVKPAPCYGCEGKCPRIKYTADNGQTGKYMCQSGLFYLAWTISYYGEMNDIPFHANRLCDDYGLDTWMAQITLEWLCDCIQSGIINAADTGLDMSKIGSIEFFEEYVRMISLRQGFGEVLAQGVERAAEKIGGEAPKMINHSDPYDPRKYIMTALLFALEPRNPHHLVHEVGYPLSQWTTGMMGQYPTHITSEVIQGIAKRFWGSEAAGDFTTIDGKALAAKIIQDRVYARESLGLCDWKYAHSDSKQSEDHLGDPTLESKYLAAVTGMDVDEQGLYRIGERVFNQQRAALIRDGHKGREDDRLPDVMHTQPIASGFIDPDCLVPDKNGNPVSRIGSVVDRDEFERMKSEYYGLRGWDVASGLQTRKNFDDLGLRDVADDLENRGLLGSSASIISESTK